MESFMPASSPSIPGTRMSITFRSQAVAPAMSPRSIT